MDNGEFRLAAQYEMANRLGYKNVSECASALGSKEFARQRNKFYEIYRQELISQNKIFAYKDRSSKSDIESKFQELIEFLRDNPDSKIKELSIKYKFPMSYLSIAISLGYINKIKNKSITYH